MINPIYFSDFIRPAARKIRLMFVVLGRFLKLLFSFNRQLTLIELDYQHKYQFDKSFLVIRYRFKNVLWYRFNGIRSTTDAGTIVLNPERIRHRPITLTVYGLGCKTVLPIDIAPEVTLRTKPFHTRISRPKDLEIPNRPVSLRNRIIKPVVTGRRLCLSPVHLHLPAIEMQHASIQINHSLFKQSELL